MRYSVREPRSSAQVDAELAAVIHQLVEDQGPPNHGAGQLAGHVIGADQPPGGEKRRGRGGRQRLPQSAAALWKRAAGSAAEAAFVGL